jgi:hypothetical protein
MLYVMPLKFAKFSHMNAIFLRVGYFSGIALGCGLDDRGFESRQGLGIFLFTTALSRLALSLGVK